MPRPGAYPDWVDVYREDDDQSTTSGEISPSPVKIARIPTLITPGDGTEQVVSDQVVAIPTHTIEHNFFSGLTVKHYYVFQGRTFNIIQIKDTDETRWGQVVKVKERV